MFQMVGGRLALTIPLSTLMLNYWYLSLYILIQVYVNLHPYKDMLHNNIWLKSIYPD